MDRTSTHVTLLLPGLESAAAALSDDASDGSLLAESRLRWSDDTSRPWEVSLQQTLGLAAGDTDIPMARALCASDDSAADSANISADDLADVSVGVLANEPAAVVCADPIHLKADRDTASLVPGNVLDLDEVEAEALIASLNEFVREDGLSFESHNPYSWILKGDIGDDVASFPPHYLAERSISPYLAESTGNVKWRRWQTEWQMLLHGHPVNQSRVASGKLPINSLWVWGGGALPDSTPMSAVVYTIDDQAVALCRGFGVTVKSLAESKLLARELERQPSVDRLVILDTCLVDAWMARDPDQLAEGLRAIDNELVPTLLDAFDRRHVSTVDIITEDGHRATLQAAGGWLSRLRKALTL